VTKYDEITYLAEQGVRARKLFSAIVLTVIDDAITDDQRFGNGVDSIAQWARSSDGKEILACAGIDPSERAVRGLMNYVKKGIRTSVVHSRKETKKVIKGTN